MLLQRAIWEEASRNYKQEEQAGEKIHLTGRTICLSRANITESIRSKVATVTAPFCSRVHQNKCAGRCYVDVVVRSGAPL